MSVISRWSYKDVAIIVPYLGRDGMTGESRYGEPYEIMCSFEVGTEQQRDNSGMEFIGRHTIYHEDTRPRYLDRVKKLGTFDVDEEIRSVTIWGMAMFNDIPDFKLVTTPSVSGW